MQLFRQFFAFCFLFGTLVVANSLQADDEGMKLFLNASRGLNKIDPLIKSILIEIDSSRTNMPPSEELIQKEINSMQATNQQYLDQISNPKSKAAMAKIFTLENATKTIRGKYTNKQETRSRFLISMDAETMKMQLQYSTLNPDSRKWSEYWTTLYERPLYPVAPSQRRVRLRWYTERRELHLENGGSGGMEKLFIGRIQGSIANTLFELCPFDSESGTKSFIEKEIGISRIIENSVEYEKNCYATKVEVRKKDKLVANMLIDASRGYTCPLLQIYNPKTGKLQEEYFSQNYFLHERSGLWFPARCAEKSYDAQTGKLLSTTENQVNSATLSVNQLVSPNEFAVDIVEGSLVQDGTQRQPRCYRAENAGVISLAPGGLDFDKMTWLCDESKTKQYVPSRGGVSGVARWVLVISGIVLIALAVLLMFFKNHAKTMIPLLLLALFLGCTQQSPSIQKINVHTSSRTLNFGEVRSSNEPVKLSFTLSNTGEVPISIQEIASDCGCTVVDPSSMIVPAGADINVPVKVNIMGRYDDFESTIHIKTDACRAPIPIHIRGKIIADIWYNARSLRCTVLSDKPATAVLDLHTIDFPDVAFDFSGIDKSITVKEISRNTKDGETTIKFDIAVDMSGQDSVTTSLTLTPTNPNIAPLIVPIYCYRSGEPTLAPELQTKAIALGTVTEKQHEVSVYGDTDLISVIKQAEFIGSPDGVLVQILSSDNSDFLRLSFQFADTENQSIEQMIEGNVKLTTAGKQEWTIPVSGLLRQRNNAQDVSQRQ